MRAKFVLEGFSEEGDPITDMGIRMIPRIQNWLDLKLRGGSVSVTTEITQAL